MDKVSGGLQFDNPTKDESEVADDCFSAINNYNLGWSLGGIDTGITLKAGETGQSWYEAESEGTWFDNFQSTDSFKIDLRARIKPGISYDQQRINIRWGEIFWDYEDLWLSES